MTVFKGYLLMAKKNLGVIIMYFTIFLVLAIIMNMSASKTSVENFSSEKLNLSVVDMDESELSKLVVAYLQEKHYATLVKDDSSELQEELYYEKTDVVIRIKGNFEKDTLAGKSGIDMTQRPGSYSGIYLMQQLNKFLGDIIKYHSAGYSIAESYNKISEQKESRVKILDLNGNGGKTPQYANFFLFMPYLFIAALGVSLGNIMVNFQKAEVKNRMMASSVSLLKQNVEAILAFLCIGTVMYLICLLVAALLYGKIILLASNLPYYLLNGYLNMLTALTIAYIVGLLAKKVQNVTIIITPLSLALSFMCGVFVPLSILSSNMKAVARFLPTYWYVTVNNLLADYSNISGSVRSQVWQGLGIQVLYLIALVGAGMAVAKYKQQER